MKQNHLRRWARPLGQHGVNIMEFCKAFNAQTQIQPGVIIPVQITIYADRSFSFVLKTPPASYFLKKAAGLEKGSPEPNRNKVARLTMNQIEEIAKLKMPDLNAKDLQGAVQTIMGSARALGSISFRGETCLPSAKKK